MKITFLVCALHLSVFWTNAFGQELHHYTVSQYNTSVTKCYRYYVEYGEISVYVSDFSNYQWKLIARSKISAEDYNDLALALDSCFGLPDEGRMKYLGGFHWRIEKVDDWGKQKVEHYENSNIEELVVFIYAFKEKLGLYKGIMLMRAYKKSLDP
jgi:hypothetical protein